LDLYPILFNWDLNLNVHLASTNEFVLPQNRVISEVETFQTVENLQIPPRNIGEPQKTDAAQLDRRMRIITHFNHAPQGHGEGAEMARTVATSSPKVRLRRLWSQGVMALRGGLLGRWAVDLYGELSAANGWKLFGQILGGTTVVVAALIAVATYHSANFAREADNADRSYSQLLSDLGHESERVRVGSISRIPPLMRLRVPKATDISLWDLTRTMLGYRVELLPAYHEDLQRVMRQYLLSLGRDSRSGTTPLEAQALLDVLRDIGPEGWYEGLPRNAVEGQDALNWVWNTRRNVPLQFQDSSKLLKSVVLDNVGIAGQNLRNCDFNGARLNGANLARSHMEKGSFIGATIRGATLSFSNLDGARLADSNLQNSDLTSAILTNADMRRAHLEEINAPEVEMTSAILIGSHANRAVLRNACFHSANLQDTELQHADLSEADLHQALLSYADLRWAVLTRAKLDFADLKFANLGSTDMRGTSLDRTLLRLADLRGADLSAAKDLLEADWTSANIAGVKGLTPRVLQQLLRKGAVQIPSDAQWRAFKELSAIKGTH
jgi:uncharacterized protein YjbI with pentapeptide repeats